MYLIEAKDDASKVLYSKDFTWPDLEIANYAISMPFTDGSKLIIDNNTNDDLHVYANGKKLGTVMANSRQYFYNTEVFFSQSDFTLTIKNSKGKVLYSNNYFSVPYLGRDEKLSIPVRDN